MGRISNVSLIYFHQITLYLYELMAALILSNKTPSYSNQMIPLIIGNKSHSPGAGEIAVSKALALGP